MFLGAPPLFLGVQKLGEKNVKMVQTRGANVVQTGCKRGANVADLVDELRSGSGFPNIFYIVSRIHEI